MTHRNFGTHGGRPSPAGAFGTGAPARADTLRDLYPLPAQSLRTDPLVSDTERSNIAGWFAVITISLCFIIPLALAGVARWFS